MDKMDETINAICDWIQENLKDTCSMQQSLLLPEMTKALAELVSARAKFDYET